MTRGQRAAQDSRLGPWKETGVMWIDGFACRVYQRQVGHMQADGMWSYGTEVDYRPLPLPSHSTAHGLVSALRGTLQRASDGLREYAWTLDPLPEHIQGPRVESVRGGEFERGQKWIPADSRDQREIELAFQPERGRWETVGKAGQRRTTLSEQTLRTKWRKVS